MTPHPVAIAEMDPATQNHAPITFARIYFNMLAEKNKPGGNYVRIANLEDEKPPVAN
jgi:hypothetical protein